MLPRPRPPFGLYHHVSLACVQHFSIKEFVFLHCCRIQRIEPRAETTANVPKQQLETAPDARNPRLARTLLNASAMSFAAVVDRVRLDFVEMPEMELTLPQAVRLWSLGMDDCRFVIDSLVNAGFLAWTPRRTIVRKGRAFLGQPDIQSNISVLASRSHNKSVVPRSNESPPFTPWVARESAESLADESSLRAQQSQQQQ
jgi:hypothetical protein